jgi:hypothetical protein
MTKLALLLISSILATGAFNMFTHKRSEQVHFDWLRDRWVEAISVREGMTRADLIKLFGEDGGLQPLGIPNRYILKSCSMIKVDVEFEGPGDVNGKIIPEDLRSEVEALPAPMKDSYQFVFVPNEKLRIKSISRPYLEPFNTD